MHTSANKIGQHFGPLWRYRCNQNRLTSGENVNPFTVVTSSSMSAHVSRIISKSECATWLGKYLNSMSSKTILLGLSTR